MRGEERPRICAQHAGEDGGERQEDQGDGREVEFCAGEEDGGRGDGGDGVGEEKPGEEELEELGQVGGAS